MKQFILNLKILLHTFSLMFYIVFTSSIVCIDDFSQIPMFNYDVIDELVNINEITCKNLNRNILETI